MKAVLQDRYGSADVLELRDVEIPHIEDDEVLVRVRAASVNAYDWHLMTGLPYLVRLTGPSLGFGLRRPAKRARGLDLAGTIEAVGEDVERFQPGDEVYGWQDGAFAEYVCTEPDHLAPKPANLTFEQAATVPTAAVTALQGLRDHGELTPGQTVLINGASGGVGTFAVQIAKVLGAHVTGVCSSRNVEMVRALGADQVIDYTREDFTDGNERYDLILDIAVSHPLRQTRRVLKPDGTYVLVGASRGRLAGGVRELLTVGVLKRFARQRLRSFVTDPRDEDLPFLTDLFEAGELTPVLERTYPLSEAAEAMAYLGEGHARGKVVITI